MDDEPADAREQLTEFNRIVDGLRDWLNSKGSNPASPGEIELIAKIQPLLKQLREERLLAIAEDIREMDDQN